MKGLKDTSCEVPVLGACICTPQHVSFNINNASTSQSRTDIGMLQYCCKTTSFAPVHKCVCVHRRYIMHSMCVEHDRYWSKPQSFMGNHIAWHTSNHRKAREWLVFIWRCRENSGRSHAVITGHYIKMFWILDISDISRGRIIHAFGWERAVFCLNCVKVSSLLI